MADTHRVRRHVKIDGAMRKPGDLIDASNLRTLDALVNQRYLEPIEAATPNTSGGRSTPDPKIAQDRAIEKAAGREGGPADDVAADSPVGDTGDKSNAEMRKEVDGEGGNKTHKKLTGKLPGRRRRFSLE